SRISSAVNPTPIDIDPTLLTGHELTHNQPGKEGLGGFQATLRVLAGYFVRTRDMGQARVRAR
ncbi:MAG: hypothetical protein ACHP7F_04450, partial [Actinomycetales bacterium]